MPIQNLVLIVQKVVRFQNKINILLGSNEHSVKMDGFLI